MVSDAALSETPQNLLLWAERGFRGLAEDLEHVRCHGFDPDPHEARNAEFMVSEAAFRTDQLMRAIAKLNEGA
jgi:hypothetical protein